MLSSVTLSIKQSSNLESEIIENYFIIQIFNPNNVTVEYTVNVHVGNLDGTYSDSITFKGYLGVYGTATYFYDVRKCYDVPEFTFAYSALTSLYTPSATHVAELCENNSDTRFTGVTVLPERSTHVYLKAFCNIPGKAFDKTYITWEKSVDGMSWSPQPFVDSSELSKLDFSDVDTFATERAVNLDDEAPTVYKHFIGYELKAHDPLDTLAKRADVCYLGNESVAPGTLYKATMRLLRKIEDTDVDDLKVNIPNSDSKVEYTSKYTLGSVIFTPVVASNPEFLVSEISNASASKALYSGSVLYNFGNPDFKNALIASYAGEVVRPISRATFLDSLGDAYVTCVTPWKDYLVVFTNISAHLITQVSGGYISNTVNSFIGVPDYDYKCAASTLNGVIFKSGTKVYLLYPNVYSGSNSILNLTDISEPVSAILEEFGESCSTHPFAFSTDSEYILMLPQTENTVCLRYNFSDKHWTFYTYPVQMYDYKMKSSTDIRVFGTYVCDGIDYVNEYILDAERTLEDLYGENIPYTDYLRPNTGIVIIEGFQGYVDSKCVLPIPFELDSGQKSDTVNVTKQYVETKLNFATLHPKDAFPIMLTVHVDGVLHPIVKDVSTDSTFWKESGSDVGVFGKPLALDNSDVFNTFRQMFVRYSGKGKSIRHIIEGESLYPFKLYDISYRYRNLNLKQ